ncbi:hypothetical protein TWF694_004470 [Orbilia ellipsospora]|uniref:Uncharacterized protein n=1 Tax=Orbilia ellipsospora TaxID=2528407 RepID=A0AAV9WWM2_9PEZI
MAKLAKMEKAMMLARKWLATEPNKSRAHSFQRIMLFHAANEAGGTAMLYNILLKTPHPLFIYYLSRYQGEGQVACDALKNDPKFSSALKSSGSQMVYSHNWSGIQKPQDLRLTAESFAKRYRLSHGPRPISYIFVNGHPAFGNPLDVDEKSEARTYRLMKFWDPSAGALHQIVPYDLRNKFDNLNPAKSGVYYVSQVTKFLSLILPLVRSDGEGTVVLKTPIAGRLSWMKSKEMRQKFANPTARSFEDAVLAYRQGCDQSFRRSPWPARYRYPAMTDIFMKSAITLYKSFSQFEKIIFHRCVFDPRVYLPDVDLLIGEDRANIPPALFSEEELESATKSFEDDVDFGVTQKAPPGIVRRVSNPFDHITVHHKDPDAKRIFSVEKFAKKYPDPTSPNTPLIRPIYTHCPDGDQITSHFTPILPKSTTGKSPKGKSGKGKSAKGKSQF